MLSTALALAVVLGAPDTTRFGFECQPVSKTTSRAASAAVVDLIEARRVGDWPRYLAAARTAASHQCPNGNWENLALGFLRNGQPELAFAAAERAYLIDPARTDQSLQTPGDTLNPLLAAPGFAHSGLAAQMASAVDARAKRIAEGHAKLAALSHGTPLPPRQIVKDACPGECCKLGDWTMAEAQSTYADAGDATPNGALPAGSSVHALEGEVHVVAEPLLVGAPAMDPSGNIVLHPGDLAFRLDRVGEGYTNFRVGEQVVMAEATWLEGRCLFITERCWGDFLRPPAPTSDQMWWVKVRLATGREVWIKPEGKIEGRCGCC